jgi:hypothetical protein
VPLLVSRESFLTEQSVESFADLNHFRLLPDEHVATNPAIAFQVETFAPAEGFQPTKPYATRLRWRDRDGNDQSKLLVTAPETVLAVAVRGEVQPMPAPTKSAPRPRRRRGFAVEA